MRIVIVGAGVAGCVMARKLSQLDGAEVTCLERVTMDDHSEAAPASMSGRTRSRR